MSTTFIVGLVGVSIHTSYTKKHRVSYYGNARFEYTLLAPGKKSKSSMKVHNQHYVHVQITHPVMQSPS